MVIQATHADGSSAPLEIEAKQTLTFTVADIEFKQVAVQMWAAAEQRILGLAALNLQSRSRGRQCEIVIGQAGAYAPEWAACRTAMPPQ